MHAYMWSMVLIVSGSNAMLLGSEDRGTPNAKKRRVSASDSGNGSSRQM